MKGKLIESSDCEGDGDSHEPERRRFTIDDLFKKSSKPSSMGIVKVRSLGNALKDFQLLHVLETNERSDDLHGDSLKPSERAFHQARFAMRDTLFNLFVCFLVGTLSIVFLLIGFKMFLCWVA